MRIPRRRIERGGGGTAVGYAGPRGGERGEKISLGSGRGKIDQPEGGVLLAQERKRNGGGGASERRNSPEHEGGKLRGSHSPSYFATVKGEGEYYLLLAIIKRSTSPRGALPPFRR